MFKLMHGEITDKIGTFSSPMTLESNSSTMWGLINRTTVKYDGIVDGKANISVMGYNRFSNRNNLFLKPEINEQFEIPLEPGEYQSGRERIKVLDISESSVTLQYFQKDYRY